MNAPEHPVAPFNTNWRTQRADAFNLASNSTARATFPLNIAGQQWQIYGNVNFSIYSGQQCNARCPFCVEELRPASRGRQLAGQKQVEADNERYFAALEAALAAVASVQPSVSITGGEPSRDPRLPRLLRQLSGQDARKRTLTSNGAGLLEQREGQLLIDLIAESRLAHLNISRAAVSDSDNTRLMRATDLPSAADLRLIAARAGDTRLRLSCVLLRGETDSLATIRAYLAFAARTGINNVVFRQLMQVDPVAVLPGPVTRYADRRRVMLVPLLAAISNAADFTFVKQVLGYYYYVEVWRWQGIDVVFEEADLARLERTRRENPSTIHELVFHPNGTLASTWQPWDGVLLTPPAEK